MANYYFFFQYFIFIFKYQIFVQFLSLSLSVYKLTALFICPSSYVSPQRLTRLVKIDASPHFAQLLGTLRCSSLPDKFQTVPDKVLGGILPPYRTGGPVASNVAKMKIDG